MQIRQSRRGANLHQESGLSVGHPGMSESEGKRKQNWAEGDVNSLHLWEEGAGGALSAGVR